MTATLTAAIEGASDGADTAPERARAARHYRLHLEPLDALSFSRDARTAGDHATLDHIPGANLWGLVTADLYRQAHPKADVAACGQGLFLSDGVPVATSGEPAWPMPLSLHFDKTRPNQPPVADGLLQALHVLDGIAGDLGSMGQARGVREGYVSQHGEVLHPSRELVMRTAVSNDRAAKGQLYGKEGLAAGLRFVAELQVADLDLDEAVRRCLGEPGRTRELRIGHSRRTEYGNMRCRIEELEAPRLLPAAPDDEGRIVLWLLADACLQSEDGSPALFPAPAALGLKQGLAEAIELDPARCFVRHRSHSAFNRHRRCHGLERQCLVAGSVLVYRVRPEHQGRAPAIRAALSQGIGVLGELGFGRVWVDPGLIGAADGRPRLRPLTSVNRAVPSVAAPRVAAATASQGYGSVRNKSLLAWASARAGNRAGRLQRDAWVGEQMNQLVELIRTSRKYLGVADHLPHGPQASQWGRLEALIRESSNVEDARNRIFGGAHAMLRAEDTRDDVDRDRVGSPWREATGDPTHPTLADWFQGLLTANDGQQDWPSHQQALCLLARRAREAESGDAVAAVGAARQGEAA